MNWVYGFAHRHSRAPRDLKDLLGGKGANLAEMTSVLALPVPPGFTITTDACRAYMATGWPGDLDAEIDQPRRQPRDGSWASRLGDPADPLLVTVRSRRRLLDARDDGHRPQPRPQRPVGPGPGRRTGTSASPSTRTAASCRCTARIVLDVPARRSTRRSSRPRPTVGVATDAELQRRGPRSAGRAVQGASRPTPGPPFPQDPTAQLRGAIEAVFRSWKSTPGPAPTGDASASPTTSAPP